ncbi:5-formyltetrahydrofolate cyclo-ligase [Violaceomyces palustris]|uniref:5-formyltetrahydrofolate cyclo-ligase n=1 Tax=Violaceomyces palustris TaxID=1673888 RepID=A0ACD0NUR6_9BASI|nr:5-formyltetrahydrofolate cyclo-ligase [Violaceomyces palustris]
MTSKAPTAASTAIRTAKRAMRKSMAATLNSLPPQVALTQSSKVAEQILRSPSYAQSKSISVYVSMDVGEINTDQICRSILRDGKRLYVPLFASQEKTSTAVPAAATAQNLTTRTIFATDMVMLRLVDLKDYDQMKVNRWGIREPTLEYESGELREDALREDTGGDGLDLILAPGVAFDTKGGRLGHGKGYYDRYFARADKWAEERGRKGPITVALALSDQVLPEGELVPSDENDRILDAIVSPEHCIKDAKSRWIST